jgi:hypothetical protein
MKVLVIAVSLLLAIAPASAQGLNFGDTKKPGKDPAREKQEDDAYKSSLRRIQPKDAASSDPWGAVRSDGNPSAQNKPKTPANTAR